MNRSNSGKGSEIAARLNTFFTLRRLMLILGGLFAAACAWVIYYFLVAGCYKALHDEIRAARPLVTILAQDPTTGIITRCDDSNVSVMNRARAFRVLQLGGLLPTDADFDQVPPAVLRALGLTEGNEPVDVCEPGVDLLVRIAQAAASDGNPESTPEEVRQMTRDHLTYALSGEPGALEAYEASVRADIDGHEPPQDYKPEGYWDPFRVHVPISTSQDEALRILFQQTGADGIFNSFEGGNSDRAAEREILIGFTRAIALGIERERAVQRSRWSIQVVQGPEQFVMIVLFLMICAVAVIQLAFRGWLNPVDEGNDEHRLLVLHRERWFIRWMIGALPSVGFIGTIRGLSAALSKADRIVSANSRAEQATEIGDVAITLALAFTTTLVALVLGLLAGFADSITESAEQAITLGRGTREVAANSTNSESALTEGSSDSEGD